MSNKARVCVEARRLHHHASDDDRRREGFALIRRFKRACNEYGIMHLIKEREFFVRPCDKRRRKEARRELELKMAQLRAEGKEQPREKKKDQKEKKYGEYKAR